MTQEKHQSHELAHANSQAGEVMMQIVVKRNDPEQDAIVVKLTKKRRRAQEGGALKGLSDWLEVAQKRLDGLM